MFRNRLGRIFEQLTIPLWQRVVFFSLGYFLCAWVGTRLSAPGSTVVSFWLPAGWFVSGLLLRPTREWFWLALGILPANFIFDFLHDSHPVPLMILIFYLSNLTHCVLGAWLVRRFVSERPALTTLDEFFGLIAYAGIFSAMLGSLIGVAGLEIAGLTHSFWRSWAIWCTGTVMAVLVFSPVILVCRDGLTAPRRDPIPLAKKIEFAALFTGLTLMAWYFLVDDGGTTSPKILLLIFPLWAGLRFGVRGAAFVVFWLALVMAYLTTHNLKGLSPADIASGSYIITLQINLAVATFVGLIPAIILGERDRTMLRLRESEEGLRATIENTPYVAVQWFDRSGRVVYWNHASELIYGWLAAEALGKTLDDLIFTSGQAAEFQQAIAKIEADGQPVGPVEFPFRHKNGNHGVVLSTLFQIQTDSQEPRFVCMDVDLTRRKQAESLTSTQMEVLEMIARGKPTTQTLETLLRLIESQSPSMVCSILLLDADGVHVRHGAAPSLPADYIKAIDGREIGPLAGSCGTAMFRRHSVFVADIATDPLWTYFKGLALPHGLRACWSTPIFDSHGQVLGSFAIYYRQPGLPDERHLQLIAMATHTAAVCLDKQRIENEREQAVTREHQARIKYTLQLILAQEAERKRIAGELHDSLGQNLLLIKNRAQMSLRPGISPDEAREHINNINDLASQCIAETRQISHDLHPPLLDHLGLTRALESMIGQTGRSSGIAFEHKLEVVDDVFSADDAMNLYRVIQESFSNILKHSGARHVVIRLERDLREVQLHIQDDGRGFAPDQQPENAGGLGLRNIAERVQLMHGKFNLASAPGQGTRIDITVPVAESAG
jgi:PAS domain S-box-containing protein